MNFGKAIPLKAEMIALNEIMSPDFMTLKGNHLVISSSLSKPTQVFTYATPSLEFLSDFGMKGNGAEEIQMFPMFCESPGAADLYVWGYSPITIKKISLSEDGEVSYKGNITLNKYEAFNHMSIIGDSVFVYYLPDNLMIKKCNLSDMSENSLALPKDDHRESYFYSNRGYIVTNESSLIHSYYFKKQIDIYDLSTLQLKTTIHDGRDYPNPTPGDFSSLVQHYVGLYAGENYFYALYDGEKQGADQQQSSLCMEVYDYNGNSIKKYSFDIIPYLFVIDEKNDMIYGFNQKHEDHLLRYNLKSQVSK